MILPRHIQEANLMDNPRDGDLVFGLALDLGLELDIWLDKEEEKESPCLGNLRGEAIHGLVAIATTITTGGTRILEGVIRLEAHPRPDMRALGLAQRQEDNYMHNESKAVCLGIHFWYILTLHIVVPSLPHGSC
jgi:hypothetical protein